ncbi:hypothetical protein BABINDRAFT_167696 [Babjeviella inositovora NRRL Y-12698]|uniref:Uncharacterized protein n=1 Tax=Babjeviella inositovora NRRL Y-12698 TaxID=984486 RepID=A0A1E3QN98_9ASCO|nr:uncharacterized protein BABINDRAFT_167696 [Babjeviella inositovora NRRL Y-12698]ODQ79165.1 hypothetical protein BABINDRAFT_167696 [Babjeviella inositovora NRRL Y-12698]
MHCNLIIYDSISKSAIKHDGFKIIKSVEPPAEYNISTLHLDRFLLKELTGLIFLLKDHIAFLSLRKRVSQITPNMSVRYMMQVAIPTLENRLTAFNQYALSLERRI